MTDSSAPFSADDIEQIWPDAGSTFVFFAVVLPGGRVGRAVVNAPVYPRTTPEQVGLALNFLAEKFGLDEVVEKLTQPGGFTIDPAIS